MSIAFNHIFCPSLQILVSFDKHIAEELNSVVLKDLGEVILNPLHSLVIWSHAGSDQTERVRIPIDEVYAALFDVFDEILSHIKACWPGTDDGKAEFFV